MNRTGRKHYLIAGWPGHGMSSSLHVGGKRAGAMSHAFPDVDLNEWTKRMLDGHELFLRYVFSLGVPQ